MLAPFIVHHAVSMDDIGDGQIGRCSITFQESLNKDSIDGNEEWWKWHCMMNIDSNVDDLKDYAGTSSILESKNLPILLRHVSSLTMSNIDA